MVEDELGSPSSRTPTESTVQRHHMGLYAGMVVAMLLTISFILMLFIDRGIRRQPDIPEALRPHQQLRQFSVEVLPRSIPG